MSTPTLALLGEKALPYAIKAKLLAYQPRTELIAVVGEHGDVDVYRQGGQRVIHIQQKELSGTASCLQWISDGEFLIVGTLEGHVDWVSVRKGRVIPYHEELSFFSFNQSNENDKSVSCLGGCTNTIQTDEHSRTEDKRQTKTAFDPDRSSTTAWFESLSKAPIQQASLTAATEGLELSPTSLPQFLAALDIDQAIPRLSPIPPLSKNQHGIQPKAPKAAAQRMIHGLLSTIYPRTLDTMDVVFVSYNDSSARLVIDRIFDHQFAAPGTNLVMTPQMHASHRSSPYHVTVQGHQEDTIPSDDDHVGFSNLSLTFYEVPFSVRGGLHSQLIIIKTIQFQALGMYLQHCIEYIMTEWNTHTILPSRFMENINETLAEKSEGTLIDHLYQLAMTGYCRDTIKEWLKDELAERGHKRWDNSMTTLYHSISHVLRVNIIPGLERLTLVASTLRGLATYYEGTTKFDVEAKTFTSIIDTLACIQLVAHEALKILGLEERQFRVFSRWLRAQVDLAAAEPGSQSALELEEREAMNSDIPKLLSYLEGPLTSSKLRPFLKACSATSVVSTSQQLNFTEIASAIKAARTTSLVDSDSTTLSIPAWQHTLESHIEHAFTQIKKWQKSTWTQPHSIPLSVPTTSAVFDIRMDITTIGHSGSIVTVLVGGEQNELLMRTVTAVDGQGPHPTHVEQRALVFSDETQILDAKVIDGGDIVLLLQQTEREQALVRLPRSFMQDVAAIGDEVVDIDDGLLEEFRVHFFGADGGFRASKMVINDSKIRKFIIVLDAKGRAWKILDLGRSAAGAQSGVQDDEGDENMMDHEDQTTVLSEFD